MESHLDKKTLDKLKRLKDKEKGKSYQDRMKTIKK